MNEDKQLINLFILFIIVVINPSTLIAQDTFTIVPRVGLLKMSNYDGTDPYSHFAIEDTYLAGLSVGKRFNDKNGIIFSYTFSSPSHHANFIDRDVDGAFVQGPQYLSTLNIHIIKAELARKLATIKGNFIYGLIGGGLAIVDPGRNEPIPRDPSVSVRLDEFPTIIDPVLSFGLGFRMAVGKNGILVNVLDNLQFCQQSGPQDFERDYLCATKQILNHPEVAVGFEIAL